MAVVDLTSLGRLDRISNTLFFFFRGAFMKFGGEYYYECLGKVPGVNDIVPGLVIKQEEG